MLSNYLPDGMDMASAGIALQSVESGALNYNGDDTIILGVSFPHTLRSVISAWLKAFNDTAFGEGHFMPGTNIILESAICRISGHTEPESWAILEEHHLEEELKKLKVLDEFTIQFITPLRLPRPEGEAIPHHRFCDADYFEEKTPHGLKKPIEHLIRRIRNLELYRGGEIESEATYTNLHWIDVSYGKRERKTIGGVVGKVRFTGRLNEEAAKYLVAGQYTGIGKNPAFGFGYYVIPELREASQITPLRRGASIFHRSFTLSQLKASLISLPNSSPGEDSITVDDLKRGGIEYLERLRDTFLSGGYVYGRPKTYRINKPDGTFRILAVQNSSDRLIHRALADILTPIAETILSHSAYAYRKGLNIEGAAQALRSSLREGYTTGIKADISAFFDSVNLEILKDTLEGLLPFEPLTEQIMTALQHSQAQGLTGLPQGSPLSPVLSNLYLDRFDKAMEAYGFRLIRYADDFVVLSKDSGTNEQILETVQTSLKKLGLTLKPDKTIHLEKGAEIKFLGFLVSEQLLEPVGKRDSLDDELQWLPLFREELTQGMPVYLTSICRGAYSRGSELIVKQTDDNAEKINWQTISRIVVVGKASFTGAVIYRAMKESVPVTFIDTLGRARGRLYPDHFEIPDLVELQRQFAKNRTFCLQFAREIISAKIHNSAVLLRRNGLDATALEEYESKVLEANDMETLRGYEGASARIYWEEFAKLVEPFEFKGRVYHPPDNIVNVMLSLGYTLLYNRITTSITDAGLNPRIGLLHKGRGNHAALASDLLEQARHIAERIVLALIHQREIKQEDISFAQRGEANVPRLTGEGFRKFIHRYETTMASKASYMDGRRMSYNAWLDEAVQNLIRAMKLTIPYRALRIR